VTEIRPIPPEVTARLLVSAGFPRQLVGSRLADWKPYNAITRAALEVATQFVEDFPNRHPGKEGPQDVSRLGLGFALIGPFGVGKTTLAALTALEVRHRYRVPVFYTTTTAYLRNLRKQISISRQADAGVPEAVEQYWQIEKFCRQISRAPLLVLDEIGREHQGGTTFAQTEVEDLLRSRYQSGLPTIAASNYDLESWGKLYTPPMGSFAFEAFQEVPMGGADLRRTTRRSNGS